MIVPLPSTGISRILSLCEVLEDLGGVGELAGLSMGLHMQLSELLLCIRGGEMLALVEYCRGQAHLLPLGQKVHRAPMSERKVMLKEQLGGLKILQHALRLLHNAEGHELPSMVVLEW